MSLSELTTQQSEIGGEIEKLLSNYKKDSEDRKTAAYLEGRASRLAELWKRFSDTNNSIQATFGDQKEHPYFKKHYFSVIEKAYKWLSKDIQRILNNLKLQDQSSNSDETKTSDGEDRSHSSIGVKEEGELKCRAALKRMQPAVKSLQRVLTTVQNLGDTESINVCQYKMKIIENYWANIEQIQQSLWEYTDDPCAAGFNETDFYALQDDVERAIINLQNRTISAPIQDNKELVDSSPQIRLPSITLPKFDGNYINWRAFHDLFLQMVHHQNLGDSQKMWYLKTSLTGEAERLIHHLTLSDKNYSSAWNMLKDRYDNTRLLVSSLLNKLLGQTAIQKESAASLKAMHDITQECILSLQNLDICTEHWDPLLLHILVRKLDSATHSLYEQGLEHPRNLQSLQNFMKFLEKRFQSLESLGTKSRFSAPNEQRMNKPSTSRILAETSSHPSCIACKGEHQLFTCSVFLKLTPEKRLRLVQDAKHCVNCLRSGHRSNDCSSRNCMKCAKKHNTLLHLEKTLNNFQRLKDSHNIQSSHTSPDIVTTPTGTNFNNVKPNASFSVNTSQRSNSNILLSTAIVKLTNKWGNSIDARAILDSGSQLNFITEKLAKQLGIRAIEDIIHIEGIGQRKQDSQRRMNFKIQSTVTGFSTNIEAHILPKIISPQPSQEINIASWAIPNNIKLADPQFHRPGSIDILIGAGLFYSTLSVGQIRMSDNLPILQNTVFGWTVSGRTQPTNPSANISYCGICSEDESLDSHIKRFWQLEETEQSSNNYTLAETKCENFFVQTSRRDSTGRIMVRLPFKHDPNKLGESCDTALRRFHSLERRFLKDPEMKLQYTQFMQEYIELGHMEEVCYTMVEDPYFFLPHHCVLKPESTTTRLRVVFDGSAKTTSNLSLNDVLAIGPAIQSDVFTTLLRFRMPRFVFTADIEKMYRQILLHPADRKYQLIWWRDDVDKPMKCYTLNTVTYGTAPASYLATRSLHKLSNEIKGAYPLASQVLKQNFYVDDVMTGSDKITTAIQTQSELVAALSTAGIKLHKWCANHPQLLKNIPQKDQAIEVKFTDQSTDSIKTMGLIWHPKADTFSIKNNWISHDKITKRTTSSDIAHIFDPLGILSPVVITAKLFLQRLWKVKLDWDAALPQELHFEWLRFREGIQSLNNITFPRHVFSHKIPKTMQLHVFADASERAYGAVAYIRALDHHNTITVRLLCAKSKVAPVKQITLPRLELSAAKLAAHLMQRVKHDLHLENEKIFMWTDSMITLGWINAESSNYHTFVANRISSIQELTLPEQWRHVKSADNPADLVSRGVSPDVLLSTNLWFYGPLFLHGSENIWPQPYTQQIENTLEKRDNPKRVLSAIATHQSTMFIEKIDHRNSYRRLQRIVAYILRFINKCRRRHEPSETIAFTVSELYEAQKIIVKHMQQQAFSDDIKSLVKYNVTNTNSKLSQLSPFLDKDGILRVMGRNESSALSYDAKHQMIIPYAHIFSRLIMFIKSINT